MMGSWVPTMDQTTSTFEQPGAAGLAEVGVLFMSSFTTDLYCKEGKCRSGISFLAFLFFFFSSCTAAAGTLQILLKILSCLISRSLQCAVGIANQEMPWGNALRGNTLKCVVNWSKLYIKPDMYLLLR